jgi:hypothetical protein
MSVDYMTERHCPILSMTYTNRNLLAWTYVIPSRMGGQPFILFQHCALHVCRRFDHHFHNGVLLTERIDDVDPA